ncbi:MAG: GNAT family N-acetyltransferase [Nitrospinaceae bacterium]|jgi:ribosomal protein S18 acetylase RimI-like enzyme|nr:GNAT family N-acetyltransferase [Nitrospinaceae bacterium]MBT3434071.1 GNAT family N-acetyltransferase [Nitrospinaceae bacterium]MBT4095138.1 GNAT family N-acetyltransferase [Nitrospinaceae bacterium]MBT4429434.1 GNAT family N-acetyltransferase [Nitrospinaceae bacterium]MBT5367699.1 GNAT family N-acetyltransferase [Nitrospinaceae bacterium]
MAEAVAYDETHRPALLALMREAFEGQGDEKFLDSLIAGSERIWLAAGAGDDFNGFCRVVADEETRARGRACMDILYLGALAPEISPASREAGKALIEAVRGHAREKDFDGIWSYFSEPLDPDFIDETNGKRLREIRLLRLELDDAHHVPQLPEGYRLRPFSLPDDLSLAAQIYNDTFAEMWNFWSHSENDIAHWFESADTAPEDCFLLEYEGADLSPGAGIAVLAIDRARIEGGDRTAYLPDIGVARDHRRRGLGGVLMAAMVGRAKEQNLLAIELIVDDLDPAAKAFYKNIGFVEMGKITVYEW